ncbi:Endo-1,4-beta-xylanase A precursor [Fulvivirga imtechensis AK7]|uniref:Endo-1,4-beta-xylanase A n=1 Tax=Fulvivirga imtechensis AK7 TaxID=1237149 RepID=L8K2W2_9BACT|nr:carbohydrate-binding protein [Fulvivirga imtechensis]ELR73792.1 Endo-1,4-beta-xylanase A precursor [Fulvivirga imtechensis AK7]
MKTIKQTLLLLAGLALSHICLAQTWQLVWQDEFTNGISSDWVFETGNGSSGWGNNELQYYRRENATVQNGNLVITAKRENYRGYNYTSARMKTQGRKNFRYGKIEARIALPSSMGLWPAFWMLGSNITSVGWPACGEIDIMEHVNTSPDIHGTIHWQDHNGNYASYGGHTATNVTGYHVYSIEWNESTIKWFLDGQQYHVVDISNGVNGTGEFHNEFFLLLNMAVGGNWPGFNIDNNALPASMYVDYVRVYQGGGSSNFSVFKEAEQYSAMSGVQTESTSDTGGGLNVGWIDTGDWMAYNSINIPSSGYYTVEYRVASINGGQLSLDLNGGSVVLGSRSVPATGGWQNWTTISHSVYINAGTYNFGIYAQSGGWNINWWRITQQNSSSARIANGTMGEKAIEEGIVEFKLYPNPAHDVLRIHFGSTEASGRIVDTSGREVLKINNIKPGDIVDISSLNRGMYIIEINTVEQVFSQRIIKE